MQEDGRGIQYLYQDAGIVLLQNHANHLRIEIVKAENGRAVRVTTCIREKDLILAEQPLETDGLVELEIVAAEQLADIRPPQNRKCG